MSKSIRLKHMSECSATQLNRLERVRDIASQSTCRNKHGAILMQGSRVLAVGVNSFRNDPLNSLTGFSVHAEVAATKIHADVPNTTLYVARVNNLYSYRDSAPCPDCLSHIINNTMIKEVIHS